MTEQPGSEQELTAMIETMATRELDRIRYADSDPAVIKRLRAVGERDKIDRSPRRHPNQGEP